MPDVAEILSFPYHPDATALFACLRHLPGAVWLDSGKPHSEQGRYDIISALPEYWLTSQQGRCQLAHSAGQPQPVDGDIWAAAAQLLERQGEIDRESSPLPFVGGLVGYWRYSSGLALNGVAPKPTPTAARGADRDLSPEAKLGWYGWALLINHQQSKSWLVFHPRCSEATRQQVSATLKPISASKRAPTATEHVPDSEAFSLTGRFQPDTTRPHYLAAIQRIHGYLAAGDCYQVNYAQRFSAPYRGDPWLAYQTLRQALPSPFGAYLNWDGEALLCCSPERFIKVVAGEVEAKPIKGTSPRGSTTAEDKKNATQLLNSPKDRAENLMIVDLLRNDLGKHCLPGSIRVPKLFALESFANVHHLVSTITGTLADHTSPLTLLRDAFPGGSITGAPKKRAMEIIAELEPFDRDIYCGSIGYISANGRLDSNIAIRTLSARDGQIYCWGGGGIVADSEAEKEYQESLHKVGVLMATLEGLAANG